MQAQARVRSCLGPDGRSRLVHVDGAPPLVPRQTARSTVHLVGAAGGPLPGDRTRLDLEVGPGATLVVGQTGATVALPGADPLLPASMADVHARVAAAGVLVVAGQPLVAARGSRHAVRARVQLGPGARLVWREVLVAGRSAEPAGRVAAALRIEREGVPVLDTSLEVGPEVARQGPLAGMRCVGTLVVVLPGGVLPREARSYGRDAVLLPLAAGDAVAVTALGQAHEVLGLLADVAAELLPAELLALAASAG